LLLFVLAALCLGASQRSESDTDARTALDEDSSGVDASGESSNFEQYAPDTLHAAKIDSDKSGSGTVHFSHPTCNPLSDLPSGLAPSPKDLCGRPGVVSSKSARGPPSNISHL
jgi:hypothetical protein